jgi:aldehyde dehydrogenase (NAD+)
MSSQGDTKADRADYGGEWCSRRWKQWFAAHGNRENERSNIMANAALAPAPHTAPVPYDGFDTMLVNGTWRHGSAGRVADDLDPYTNDVLVRIPLADERDLDEAFRAAAAAQPKWYSMLPAERSAVLRRAATIMEERRGEIVEWLVRESGSTRIKANIEWEIAHAVTLEAATFPSRVEGPILPTDIPGKESRVYRQPVGMISPWNFPMHLSSRSVAPALAVGNAVVIKPASNTPVTGGLLLAKIYEEAGLPTGVLNVVIGAGSVIGDAFVRHPVPRVISFTGSTEVGRHIAELAAQSPILKRVVLELEGELSVRHPRRRRPGPRGQRRRLRQISAPGADLHGD